MIDRTSLRLSATLLLVGQLLYVVVTLFHADGDANNHPAIFAEYAGSGIWTAVHVGQFACMAIMLAGLLALFFALDVQAWNGEMGGSIRCRFGGDGAGAVRRRPGGGRGRPQAGRVAWASAPDAEKAARFASAEAIRWLEWGMRSYQNFTLGLAVLLFAVAVVRTAWVPRPIRLPDGALRPHLPGAGLGGRLRGILANASIAIVLAEVLSVAWMIWLVVVAWRMQARAASTPSSHPAAE